MGLEGKERDTMKLLFEDKITSWLDCFDIFDEIGRKLFRVEAKPDGHRLKVYDLYQRNKSLATVWEDEKDPFAVEIKHGTRYVSTVKRAYRKFRSIFELGFLNWRAAGDFGEGTFRIFDGNNRTIASVCKDYYNHKTMRVVDTLPEYFLYSLTFTLAIDVQISGADADVPLTADP